jgi:hypothetical protein
MGVLNRGACEPGDAVTTGVPGRFVYMSLQVQDFLCAQPAFLTQNLHQPAGLISPSTSVQALGTGMRCVSVLARTYLEPTARNNKFSRLR